MDGPVKDISSLERQRLLLYVILELLIWTISKLEWGNASYLSLIHI